MVLKPDAVVDNQLISAVSAAKMGVVNAFHAHFRCGTALVPLPFRNPGSGPGRLPQIVYNSWVIGMVSYVTDYKDKATWARWTELEIAAVQSSHTLDFFFCHHKLACHDQMTGKANYVTNIYTLQDYTITSYTLSVEAYPMRLPFPPTQKQELVLCLLTKTKCAPNNQL